jgi:hypothetical protein
MWLRRKSTSFMYSSSPTKFAPVTPFAVGER